MPVASELHLATKLYRGKKKYQRTHQLVENQEANGFGVREKAIFGRKTGRSWAGFRCLFGRKATVLLAKLLQHCLPRASHL